MSQMGDRSMYTLAQIRKRKGKAAAPTCARTTHPPTQPPTHHPPYCGFPAHYLLPALRNSPLVVEQLGEMWKLIPGEWDRTSPDASLPLEAYIQFSTRLYKALIAPSALMKEAGTSEADEAEIARKVALADWEHDTQHTGGRMTQQTFSDSVFELVDVWSEGTDETEYAALMWRLSRAVMDGTDEADAFVTWKRGDEIKSMVQSETKKLIKQYVADSHRTDPNNL